MRDSHNTLRALIVTGAIISSLACTSVSALAQHVPLAELLPHLILSEIKLNSPPLPTGSLGAPEGFTHEAHFSPIEAGDLNNPAVKVVRGFNGQMATQF